jgi:hypothetical protein
MAFIDYDYYSSMLKWVVFGSCRLLADDHKISSSPRNTNTWVWGEHVVTFRRATHVRQ